MNTRIQSFRLYQTEFDILSSAGPKLPEKTLSQPNVKRIGSKSYPSKRNSGSEY
jgi:hypothetical protein